MKKNLFGVSFILIELTTMVGYAQGCSAYFEYLNDTSINSIQFYNLSSGATNWDWHFGDGDSSNLQSPYHTYPAPGNYTACLTIKDSNIMCSDTMCLIVTVTNTWYGRFYYFPTIIPDSIRFCGVPLASYPTHWIWNFGDGATSTDRITTHRYAAPGIYSVCLHAYDTCMYCTWTVCDSIRVGPHFHIDISTCDGAWTNPGMWNNNAIPLPGDTVLIYNHVYLDTNVIMNPANGILFIDTLASLCGHKNFQGRIITFGEFNIDYLTINGVEDSYSDFIPVDVLNTLTVVTTYVTQQWPNLAIPFNCASPNSCFTSTSDLTINTSDFIVSPNPVSENVTIRLIEPIEQLQIFSVDGILLQQFNCLHQFKFDLDVSNLGNGLYFITASANKKIYRGKILLEH